MKAQRRLMRGLNAPRFSLSMGLKNGLSMASLIFWHNPTESAATDRGAGKIHLSCMTFAISFWGEGKRMGKTL